MCSSATANNGGSPTSSIQQETPSLNLLISNLSILSFAFKRSFDIYSTDGWILREVFNLCMHPLLVHNCLSLYFLRRKFRCQKPIQINGCSLQYLCFRAFTETLVSLINQQKPLDKSTGNHNLLKTHFTQMTLKMGNY